MGPRAITAVLAALLLAGCQRAPQETSDATLAAIGETPQTYSGEWVSFAGTVRQVYESPGLLELLVSAGPNESVAIRVHCGAPPPDPDVAAGDEVRVFGGVLSGCEHTNLLDVQLGVPQVCAYSIDAPRDSFYVDDPQHMVSRWEAGEDVVLR